MKILIGVIAIIVIFLGGWFGIQEFQQEEHDDPNVTACTLEAKICPDGSAVGRTGPNCEFAACPSTKEDDVTETADDEAVATETIPDIEIIGEGFEIPWGLAFLPHGNLLVAERTGSVIELHPNTGLKNSIDIPGVKSTGEGGLLGLALHPNYTTNNFVYLYMTEPDGLGTKNRVARFTYTNGVLTNETTIIDNIPGAHFHDGGRIAFGPDGFLYITTGDATDPEIAQDLNSLGGKILRLTDNGEVPGGNPFDSAVYSYGHRNPQGLTWDEEGNLWSTEHGRSGLSSGLDELNRIVAGSNYGWPESEGDEVAFDTVGPVLHSGPDITWAPASAAYLSNEEGDGSIFFGGLRGATLYEAVLNDTKVAELKEHLVGMYGRIRTVIVGPDDMLYITTSNRDGRGNIQTGDDKIIRLNPTQFR